MKRSSESYSLSMSLKAFPAVNLGTFFAAIFMVGPVSGFFLVLAFLFASENVPKSTRATLSPFLTAFMIASIAPSSAFVAHALVHLDAAAIFSIRSDFVITPSVEFFIKLILWKRNEPVNAIPGRSFLLTKESQQSCSVLNTLYIIRRVMSWRVYPVRYFRSHRILWNNGREKIFRPVNVIHCGIKS